MKKIPMRTCVICNEKADKRTLMRIIRTEDGQIAFDPTGKKNGRGAYVCRKEECADLAKNKKRINNALEAETSLETLDAVTRQMKRYLFELSMGGHSSNAKKGL